MTSAEKLEIAAELQNHHYFFRAFWDIGEFNIGEFEDVDTAAIEFDESGQAIKLIVNKTFWDSLNKETKMFLICHEMLHVLLNHGYRFAEYIKTPHLQTMNIAADVVINEMLCKSFGFSRHNLDDRLKNEGCWFDTVFKNKKIRNDESTEFYFNKLKNATPPSKPFFNIDKHNVKAEDLQNITGSLIQSGVFDAIDDKLLGGLPENDKESLQTRSPNGTGVWHTVNVNATKKKKWETVIKKWESFHTKEEITHTERWERVNPRYSGIISDNIHLPTESKMVDDSKQKDAIDVFFFLDTSGSCIGLKDRFFKAAKSLNSKKFNIRLFCFDTKVVETTIESGKVYGGGGTSFDIIERKIQSIINQEKINYPKAVFIITDGYGNPVTPQKPETWHWFLTSQYTSYIPKESKVYKLSSYE